MEFTNKRKRRLIQAVAMFLLLQPLFLGTGFWFGTYLSADFLGLALTDPLTVLEVSAAAHRLWLPLLLSCLPLVLAAMIFGRIFCSFICPLHFFLEFLPEEKKKQTAPRGPLFVLLLVLLFSFLLEVPVFAMFSPVHIVQRLLLFGVGLEGLFLAALALFSFFQGAKSWCRLLCPLGALYGLLGFRRQLFIDKKTERCTNCRRCEQVCTMGTSPMQDDLLSAYMCTNCGDCIDSCQIKALSYRFGKSDEKKRGEPL